MTVVKNDFFKKAVSDFKLKCDQVLFDNKNDSYSIVISREKPEKGCIQWPMDLKCITLLKAIKNKLNNDNFLLLLVFV